MTVSVRVMSAGDGFRYLLRSVAAADGDRTLSTPLTRYYQAKGTPPGRWVGSGLHGMAGGSIAEHDEVTEEQLQLLIGRGRDPVTGESLGRAYPEYGDTETRRRAVAGYDFTFSIPKSASVLWGIADATTQALIAQAHHDAVADTVAFLEREVAATRTGAAVRDGAVAQVGVHGVIATAFDHFNSRAGDPHLHTHVVISNKVQTVLDGRWRSLDGRPLHAAVVALSELHEALFADALTRSLGVLWEPRDRGRDRNPAWAISAVPEPLVAEFSSRSRHIDVETDRLIEAYASAHGRRPSRVTIMKLRAQATLMTRPAKEVRSLADLTAEWRTRANRVLGKDVSGWAGAATSRRASLALHTQDIPLEEIDRLGEQVMRAVSEKRATWRHWNLAAEASRQTMHLRFASAEDREAVFGLVVDAAERASLQITPPELASSPITFRRADGTSVFRPKYSTVFTSTELLDAETRLLTRGADQSGPRVPAAAHDGPARRRRGPVTSALADRQLTALTRILESGRVVDVLIGPAGTGKTTAMNALRLAWETAHGPGSVVGLAPSAAAARVLAEDLGIATENLAKWWQNHLVRGDTFRTGQLVIIDEASLASTLSLDRVTLLAADAGAKVVLVGDYAQLQSVDAGGAFALLVRDRWDAAELVDVHRFTHDWERSASLDLRRGAQEAIDTYVAHGRVAGGTTEAMVDAAYLAWRADALAGHATVLISDSNEAVTALNMRARTDLILEGRVDALREVELHDGSRAAVGDTILTRRNERRLRTAHGWVRNGDRWRVLAVRRDGTLEVRRAEYRRGKTVVLPPEYVQQHVELGYAVTSHRAQGITTDTAHVVVAPGMTRESFYVAMTRGRASNAAYVAVDRPDLSHTGPRPGDVETDARSILFGVLQHVGAELSAHEMIAAEQDAWGSIAQLAAEYETIAAAAQHDRWVAAVHACGLPPAQADAAIASDAFGPLTAELRRAEAHHFDADRLLARVAMQRGFDDAQDVAAALCARVASAVARGSAAGRARSAPLLIAGLLPEATGPMDAASRRALAERAELMEARAEAVLVRAFANREAWVGELGRMPRTRRAASAWRGAARTVAAYRDRYGSADRRALGATPQIFAQQHDAARARVALEAAKRSAEHESSPRPRTPMALPSLPSVGGGV